MSWDDRLIEAAYTPPSGDRLTFDYEDVSRSITKRTAAFGFPDADGTLVQSNGNAGRKYPLRCIFSGPDCDTEAATFFDALTESGAGTLEHPAYGKKTVVPYGKIQQVDALLTAANQVIIEVTFWETIGTAYPTSQTDGYSEVSTAVATATATVAEEYADTASLDSEVERATVEGTVTTALTSISSGLSDIAATDDTVNSYFGEVYDSIDASLDTLLDTPETLMIQVAALVQCTALAGGTLLAKISAYTDLIDDYMGTTATAGYDSSNANDFYTQDAAVGNYLAAMVTATANESFDTKADALEAAETLLDTWETVRDWRDDNYESLGEVDLGGSHQALQEAVSLAAGYLVTISFSLKQEHTLTLTRPRTIIDLAAELYGEVDDQLDYIIDTNSLSGSEILEVPKGREVVYYV